MYENIHYTKVFFKHQQKIFLNSFFSVLWIIFFLPGTYLNINHPISEYIQRLLLAIIEDLWLFGLFIYFFYFKLLFPHVHVAIRIVFFVGFFIYSAIFVMSVPEFDNILFISCCLSFMLNASSISYLNMYVKPRK